MVETIEIRSDDNNNEFWPNATKYSSWSKGGVQILKRTIIYFGYIKKFKIAKYLKLAVLQ